MAPAAPPPLTAAEAASPLAEALLKQSLQPRREHVLPGRPVALAQVVERASGGTARIRAVQTYWKLVAKVAAYHAALDDQQLFAQIDGRQLRAHDRAALFAAQAGADAAVDRAELEFVIAQHELAEAARFGEAERQALPSDIPLVSEYRTHFTSLYSGGQGPSGLRRLDRAIPYHLRDVRSRAEAVDAGQQAVQAAAQGVAQGEAGMATLLEVHRHYADQRSAFAGAVFDYNAMIAEYALNVAPHQSPATVVGMLIKTAPAPRGATVVRDAASVRTVSAEETLLPADRQPILQPAQATFADDDEVIYADPSPPRETIEFAPARPPVQFRQELAPRYDDEDDDLQPPPASFLPDGDDDEDVIYAPPATGGGRVIAPPNAPPVWQR